MRLDHLLSMENRDAKSGAETEDEGSSGFGMRNSEFGITDVYREGFTDRKTREGDKKGFPQKTTRDGDFEYALWLFNF